jgi:hypothetical protein
MAITGAMLALGTLGLVVLRRTTEVQGGADSLVSAVKETQNKAKNNSFDINIGLPTSVYLNDIFGFKITFDGSGAYRYTCHKTAAAASWSCLNLEYLKNPQFSQVKYANPAATDCKAVLFVNLTGDIRVNTVNTSDNDALYTNAVCTITVSHLQDANTKKTITFDGINNNFKIN